MKTTINETETIRLKTEIVNFKNKLSTMSEINKDIYLGSYFRNEGTKINLSTTWDKDYIILTIWDKKIILCWEEDMTNQIDNLLTKNK